MVGWLGDNQPETDAQRVTRQNVVFALSAQAQFLGSRRSISGTVRASPMGARFMRNTDYGCASCHKFRGCRHRQPRADGWGSREWMIAFINDPEHPRFFGRDNDRMPSFGKEKSLSNREIEMVVDWLRNDWPAPKRTEPRQ
jgi:ubiquinol-cytochrome c reductase cytochrome b subunit